MSPDQNDDGGEVLLKVSVGHRLFLLVALQTAIATCLVVMALRYVSEIAEDSQYMYRFQLLSLADLGKAQEYAAELQTFTRPGAADLGYRAPRAMIAGLVGQLEEFDNRYRTQWQTAEGTSDDAKNFRRELVQTGQLSLIEKEKRDIQYFENSLRSLREEEQSSIAPDGEIQVQAPKVREAIADLLDDNIEYAEVANGQVLLRARAAHWWLLAIGSIGTVLTLTLGLLVYHAIAPRIRRLVGKVQVFRDLGVNEKISDTGDDEIAVLGTALDTGFAAIAARDRERDQFLAVAAHELKTPITSIHGFASVLAAHPDNHAIADRAVESISRQSWRLSRLVEHLFLAMRMREGAVKFEPKPFDLSALVVRSVSEITPFFGGQVFSCELQPFITVLGDEPLLEHAIWSLFTCASAICPPEKPLGVILVSTETQARLLVDVPENSVSFHDTQSLFVPFGSVQYEDRSGIRAAMGLYLCKQIVQLHSGRLDVSDKGRAGIEFWMELPR
jgi:signal transduction histidine kinase